MTNDSRAARGAFAAAILLTLAAAAAAPAASTPAAPVVPAAPKPAAAATPATPVHLVPKAWKRSTYSIEGRIENGIGKATFEAPEAYQKSFAFWIDRMKGTMTTELIEMLTTTLEPGSDGRLPFRRQVSRFEVDMVEQGQAKAAGTPVSDAVLKLLWEGSFDPLGNIADIKQVQGPEDQKEIDRLSFPLLAHLFPRLTGPLDMKPGESFKEESQLPLPSHLTIRGLENMGLRRTRVFTLREVGAGQAVFDVDITDVADPATPPTAPRTTCLINGSGRGEVVFGMEEGMFVKGRIPSTIELVIDAPLRPLPGQPEGQDPGTARVAVTMGLTMSGTVKLARLFEDSTAVPYAGTAAPAPAGATPPAPAATPPAAPGR
jgi:hypothetical protein